MNKAQIKKLASLYGLGLQYFDEKDKPKSVNIDQCLEFLKTLGVDTESEINVDKKIKEIELNQWANYLDTTQVVKNDKYAVIKIKVSKKQINSILNWQIIEENGQVHKGQLKPSDLAISGYNQIKKVGIFYQFDFPMPVQLDIGYHTFELKTPDEKTYSMRLIAVPNNAYIPETLLENKKHNNTKLRIKTVKKGKANRIIDSSDLKYIIRKADKEKNSMISIGAINQIKITDESYNPLSPSSKLFFNTMYLNIDNVINILGDKTLAIKVLSGEYQETLDIEDDEEINYKKIYNAKLEAFKTIYQSFRQNHINKETDLAKEFYTYVNARGEKFRKIALFRALEEYFYNEDKDIDSWRKWPHNYQHPNNKEVEAFRKNNIELVQFYEFWQWQEDLQLEQIGKISFDKGLDVGLMAELPYNLDPQGADAWLKQEIFCYNESNFFLIPNKLKEDCYEYFIETLRTNMRHTGAIKFSSLKNYSSLDLVINNQTCKLQFKTQDLLGIMALESHRNKCLLICDQKDFSIPKIKQLTYEYNILNENFFDTTEIEDETSFKKIFIKTSKKRRQDKKLPLSTYRLQLNKDFNFTQAKELIPYLKELGISHCYISPVLKARSDSKHGYDIVNHKEFHESIGSREDFYEFADTLHENGLGLICDIVPNHMGISQENIWWYDLLENGQASQYADYFDIDWQPINKNLHNKVLVPILGEHYGDVLNKGLLNLKYNEGTITLNYYEHKLPINPSTYPQILAHRLEILSSRIGSTSSDFLEYQSIITSFENLPDHNEDSAEKRLERKREKTIAISRLKNLTEKNKTIIEFINENIEDFKTYKNDTVKCNRLNSLLEQQAYHIAYWRVSVDEINYRRFFDVNDLAAICVENPNVFEHTHQFILDLIEEEKIDGLRIDHPDGLLNPTEYFQRLQEEVGKRVGIDFFSEEDSKLASERLPIHIWAEKILAPFERMPDNWAITGTVGYDFLNSLNGIFVKKENKEKFGRIYRRFIKSTVDYEELVVKCKKLIMQNSLAGELSVLANKLTKIAESDYNTRDFTYNSLRAALTEIISHFPVYRTYILNEDYSYKNAEYIKWAVSLAKKSSSSTELSIFDFIEKVLLLEFNKNGGFDENVVNFASKFQQYTSPLMAKGLEDTVFYRYNPLISLNEVGAEPEQFGCSIQEFHHNNINRLNEMPLSMLCTSTHDTKRSEDVRARINVLSEIPQIWQRTCNTFSRLNDSRIIKTDEDQIPSKNDEYLFYQTLIGIWPEYEVEEDELNFINSRLCEYMIKAMRESKDKTSWLNMNTEYEEGVISFIEKIIFSYNKHPFWKEFINFKNEIQKYGNINSLSQSTLKVTSPGVCDIYQGMEQIGLYLVDPDNRKPVDFNELKDKLIKLKQYTEPDYDNLPNYNNIKGLSSSEQKMYINMLGLNLRKNKPELILNGDYIPLEVEGNKDIIAFARVWNNQAIITIVPTLNYGKLEDNTLKINDTYVIIPEGLQKFRWKNLVDQKYINSKEGSKIEIDFTTLPVSILESY